MRNGWLCLLLLACASDKSADPEGNIPRLEFIAEYAMNMSEPSGLALGAGGEVLWAVGNAPERVYKLTTDGQVLDALSYVGQDLEGIAYDPTDSTLWIAEEERREIVQLDQSGTVLKRHALELDGGFNNGLEGFSLDDEGSFYLLNEKNPGLFIALNPDLSVRTQRQLDFATDYSGLAYDRLLDGFWVLSHEDQALYFWTEAGGVSESYETPVPKVEGVAVDANSGRLYIVSEADNTLHVYALGAGE
ncbi:MAG: SdiA-regulated domain-containing protein [Candidatus Latescibacterota bacterium]|nr:SdiA-regulated domain-containing protein [Candidatus Latescibacterota bacterium]